MSFADVHPEIRTNENAVDRPTAWRVAITTVVVTVALCVAAGLILRGRERARRPDHRFPESTVRATEAFSGVREQLFLIARPAPTVFDRQRAWLSHYGWIDQRRGIVHIPIERAMELVAGPVTEAAR